MAPDLDALRELTENVPKEAVAFFAIFARCEYALKRDPKFLRSANGAAEANWDAFAAALTDDFLEEIRRSRVAKELLEHPPRKQIVRDAVLAWSDPGPQIDNVQELFAAIRRVRNNLFHGGKFAAPTYVLAGTERERNLLGESRAVLERALDKCPSVKGTFLELPNSGP
ncbi:MAG: hypothetical protein KGJ66_07110 [Alphaproteobacteria bacterium]|nr:hypothetical protein [Alphaproteobacteria bacterium]